MLDKCAGVLAKLRESLLDGTQLINFFKSWYGVAKYADEILLDLQKKSLSTPGLSFKVFFKA